MAWGEVDRPLPASSGPLGEARRAVHLPSQLIHGDLSGNVLSHPVLAPAVIDISPYGRPAAYADAILVVDETVSGRSNGDLLGELLDRQGRQLLMRAVIFRALADPQPTDAYEPLIERLLS